MSATNQTMVSLYEDVTALEEKLKEIDPSYSLDENLTDFQCKINYTVILDPVVAADGITYDRAFITAWVGNNDISPWTREELEHKNLSKNIHFSTKLIERLEKEKELITKRLNSSNPERNKTEVQSNEISLSDEVSSVVSASNAAPDPVVLAPVSEVLPLSSAPSISSSQAFFSAAASASQSSSSSDSSVQTVFLNEHDSVWQRCLELRNHLRSRFLADTTNIEERFIVDDEDAKQQYVNLISYVEEQIERTGEMTSAEIELLRRALVPMIEYKISIPGGRVIEPNDIMKLYVDISEFSVEMAEEMQLPALVAPVHVDVLPPLTSSASAFSSETEVSLMRSAPSLSFSVMPSSSSAISSSLSSFYAEPDEAMTVRLTEADVWQRCLQLRNLLTLAADSKSQRSGFFNGNAAKQEYVKLISMVEAKQTESNVAITSDDEKAIRESLYKIVRLLIVYTPDNTKIIHMGDIKKLYADSSGLSKAGPKQIEEYTQLMERRAKLDHLEKIVEKYGAKYALLLENIRGLRGAIIYEIEKMKQPSLATIELPPLTGNVHQPFWRNLWTDAPLSVLMRSLQKQFFAQGQGPLINNSSHIFSEDYEQSIRDNKFRSKPFSPCSPNDEKVLSGGAAVFSSMSDLFNPDKTHTSRAGIAQLEAELKMIGIPARIEKVNNCRFQHGASTVSGVRVVFDCDDNEIFNVALALEEIRYQHNPQSVVAHLVKNEPTITHHSLLLPNSDLDLPNPNSSSSRFGRNN